MKALLPVLALLITTSLFAQAPGARKGRDERMPDRLQVGETAPDWNLKTVDGGKEVQLSAFRGKRPVVLVFGSYT